MPAAEQRPAVTDGVPPKARTEAIRGLADDEQVAAEAATRLLHRPDAAFKTMSDDYPDYGLTV
ncbi:DUF6192 family protein [Streptomyces ochraceiscleroticus]|uniref:DUF6192 family protein n=1 Tax=Streptomyces ochraceiscleroticus TaxID=47761 RepID=A0ABW1MMZ9_9ACTN|nr:DUF6192 family protein [Streptomyces ochraceiscleroticus]